MSIRRVLLQVVPVAIGLSFGTALAQDEPPATRADTRTRLGVPQPVPDPTTDPNPEVPPTADVPPRRPPRLDMMSSDGFGGVSGGGGASGAWYAASWYPSRPVKGQNTDFGAVRQNLSVTAPVWKDGADSLSLTLGVRETHFDTDALLPDTSRPFPRDLWNVNLGASYNHVFGNGWVGILKADFGSPSDKPFNSFDELNVSVTALLRVPARNSRDAWMFGLAYSSAGNLNFPLPLISYSWNPSEQFQMNIGLPLSLTWRPTEDWTLNVTYVPLTNLNARVTYRATERLNFYAGYENVTESYFLADRADKKDRFFVAEQRVLAGLRWGVLERATLDFNAGYAFGRRFGEGRNQGSDMHDRVDVAPGAFLAGSFRIRF